MREFKTLNPKNLPDGYSRDIHTEEPIVEVMESKGKITINYAFPGFYMTDEHHMISGKKTEMKKIQMMATGYYTESGKPLLPSFGRYIQIPMHCDYKISVQKSQPVNFENIMVAPAQTHMMDSPADQIQFEFNKDFYSKDMIYPDEIIKISGPFIMDQYRMILLHITPLQYNPAKKMIMGYGNITATIECTEKEQAGTMSHADYMMENEAIGNLILNPATRIEERMGFKMPQIIYRPTGPTFMIIYAKIFEKAAMKLASWKNHCGMKTECICIDDIVSHSEPHNAYVAKLKEYIRKKRSEFFSRLRYVMFFGDTDMIYPETDLTSVYGPGAGVSDYYYSTKYDHHTPDPANPAGKIFLPWLSIGRIPVRPDTETTMSGDLKAMKIVNQIISYEKTPPSDCAYYKKQVFAAYCEDDNMDGMDDRGYLRTMEEIRTTIASMGYATERIYVTNNPEIQYYDNGAPIPDYVKSSFVSEEQATQMLIDATTDGQLIIGHRDHGSFEGWVHPKFGITELEKVEGEMPSVFYSINCQSGSFDTTPSMCFAEYNLLKEGTAPSMIAATRNTSTYLNNAFIKALYDGTFAGVIPTYPGSTASYPVKFNRLGDILNYAKCYLPVAFSGPDALLITDHLQNYHVIGDPTIEMWKELPEIVTIYASVIRRSLDIRMSSCPANSVITIWLGDKMIKKIMPSSTHIRIPIMGMIPITRPFDPRMAIMVCFKAPGCRYTTVRIPVTDVMIAGEMKPVTEISK